MYDVPASAEEEGGSFMKARVMARPRPVVAAAIAGLAVLLMTMSLAGASSASTAKTVHAKSASSHVITWAEAPGATPNWIWPFVPPEYLTTANADDSWMYLSLYSYGTAKNPLAIDEAESPADAPVYSNHDKTVTIKMKGWKWSNGETVDAQDLIFWINMVKAEKSQDANYVKGDFPDNVVSYKATSKDTLVMQLSNSYAPLWFTDNELSQMTPMPLAWDVTGPGKKGTCATSIAGCPAVFKYLSAQSSALSSWATSPLWQIVDGAFKLKSFSTDGEGIFVRNKMFSGQATGNITELEELPYTSTTAEWNAIKAGSLDYGTVPPSDVAEAKHLAGYKFFTSYPWETNFIAMNFTSPAVGVLFKQLYIRQALNYLVDQASYIKAAYDGLGYATTGVVPVTPSNPYSTSYEKSYPYKYNPKTASKLLKDHGWKVIGGVATCEKPGTGSSDCGAGIAKGKKLALNLVYASGTPSWSIQMEALKSEAGTVGIDISLSTAPFDTVYSEATPCAAGKSCPWEMAWWGAGWYWGPDFYPTGDEVFVPGAGSNWGGYNDPKATSLIVASTKSDAALAPYENYTTKQAPVVFMPDPLNLYIAKSTIKGYEPTNALGFIFPQNWSISS